MSTAPPQSVGTAPTANVPGLFAGYEHVLAGYRPQDFPDLSSRRFAPDAPQSASQALIIDAGLNTVEAPAIVTAALGRVLGAYCGCSDVLLAIADDQEEKLRPVRVAWGDGQAWSDTAGGVARALADPHWPRITPAELRSALELTPKQSPCPALICIGRLAFPSLGEGIPLVAELNRDDAVVSITASERVCHPSQSRLLLSQVAALITHAQANPKALIASLPPLPSELLSSYDKHSLEECCSVYGRVPPVKLATDHLTLQAAQQPHNIAVRWYGDLSTDVPIEHYIPETITYAELDRRANQVARWLRQVGVEKGNAIAVCMKRDVWFHICFIGILRAGACYVPIDAELPMERQQFIAKDSSARYILSTSDLSCFTSLGNIAIDIKDPSVQRLIDQQSADEVAFSDPDDTSYILYTSGTTGTPKGCILTQRGLSEAIWAISAICANVELEDPSQGNYLSIASVAFDVHLAEILVPLALGIPILAAPRSLLLEDLPYYVKHLRVSHVGIVPSLIEATMGAVQEDEESGHATSLRYIASGGEKMSDAILDKWASHPKVRLANFYGPSEVTIGCAARFMDKDTPRANIGHTFANVGAYVVDENMNILLRGGTGELVVEGPLVGRGYVGRPDLTQKVFLKFPNDGTERWAYRTGDLVRMMPDATLEIIGRIDTQIKLRGVRIESEGISSILRNAAAPKYSADAITILAKHPAIGIDQLVSFVAWDPSVSVATRKGGKPSLARPPEGLLQQMRSTCDRELASYMRPSHIIPLAFIPLSSNGKADAKVLSAFFLGLDLETLTQLMADGRPARAGARNDRREPSDIERKVMEVLKPYVKISADHLGPNTNVYECGLDSLAVARLAADLRRSFWIQVAPVQIMQRPAISEIAQLLESDPVTHLPKQGALEISRFASAVREEVENAYSPDSIDTLLPPFPVQEGVLYRSANSPSMYVQHVVMRIAPETSVSGLEEAWKELAAHHEMLRTVFHFGSELVQVVLRPHAVKWRFPEEDVLISSDVDFQTYVTNEAGPRTAREINSDISRTPAVRLSFYMNRASGTTYAVLSIHHALYDGISLPVLMRDLERMYTKQQQLPSAPLHAILEQIVTIDQTAAREFWTSYLQGFAWQRLLNKSASSPRAEVTTLTFKQSLSQLQAKAAAQHITLQALLMSAYGYLLGQHVYGHDDVTFGVIRTGRSLPVDNIETTLCPMITVVPARVRFGTSEPVLQAVQRDIARVSEFEHIPLSRIQKWVPESGGSLFDTLFSVSFKEHDTSSLWRVIESQNPEPDYILAVEVVLDPEHDQLIAHAASTSSDISATLVNEILQTLEVTADKMIEGNVSSAALARTHELRSPPLSNSKRIDANDNVSEDVEVDNDIVRAICTAASQFLRIDLSLIAPDTSLLSLGLDSIKSVGLSRKLSHEGLRLSSADIMGLSTPRRLAARLQKAEKSVKQGDGTEAVTVSFKADCELVRGAIDLSTIKLSGDDDVQVFPTTTLQAGMLSQTVASNGRLYVHLFPMRLSKDVDAARLRDAWQKAISLFDILRTSFHFLPGPGLWAQAVHSITSLHWSEAEYDPSTNLVESLNPLLRATDENDFFREPPVFLNLLKANDPNDADLLVVVLHHALYDGLAIAKLFDSVAQLYDGREITSPPKFHGILPHLLWQEKNGTDFWVTYLQDLHATSIPRKSATSPPAVHQVTAPLDLSSEEMLKACRDAEVTPQCFGQAAFAKLLAVLTGSPDVVFGRVVSGRDVPGAEEVIGPMLNTVPCRVKLSGDASNKAVLKHVHQHNIASMAWQHASLRSLQRRLGVSSLWDSIFVFQPRQESSERASAPLWTFDTGDVEEISMQYALNLELHEEANGYVVQAACTSEVADATKLRELVDRYAHLLSELARHLDKTWSDDVPDVRTTMPNGQVKPSQAVNGEHSDDWDMRLTPIRDVIAAVAKVPSNTVHLATPLAALGIDSISAVQLVAKARRIGFRLTSSDVVQSRTIEELLAKVKETKPATVNGIAQTAAVEVPRDRWLSLLMPDVERIVHASPGMEWMLGMWQRSDGSRFQHVFGYRLPVNTDKAKLRAAWDRLIHRHAILRSTFVYDRDAAVPRIVVFKPEALSTHWTEDVLGPSDQELEEVVTRMKTMVSHPPPISRPITRAVLLQSEQSFYLLIHLHHFQYDAWSLQLLIDDLSRLYKGEEPRSSNDLDSFLRFTALTPAVEQEQREYWKSASAAIAAPTLFPSLSNAPPDTGREVHTDFAVISDAAALEKRSRELGVSLQSVFLACWAQVQSKKAQSDAATFSLWHSGRTGDVKDVERLAVPCINALPYNVSDVGGIDTLALARRIQADLQARSALIEQTRLAKVHEWLGVADRPFSNVYVNIIKVAPEVQNGTENLLVPLEAPYYIPRVPLDPAGAVERMRITELVKDDVMVDIVVLEKTDKVAMSIEATTAVLDASMAKSIVEEWASLVKACLV
ncbi:hypothetical protein FKP32DRAFT_1591881 [Trametes sanguinea]|nr:hypothetical protein FKP32DRAFT_1591881 [Trametes sanguinea]